MKKMFCAVALTALMVSGCAGRPANPTTVVQATDTHMTCSQLSAAASEAESRAQQSYAADKAQEEKNTAIGVAGALLFWPALFAMETGDHNLIEAQAHDRRAEHLRRTMQEKNC